MARKPRRRPSARPEPPTTILTLTAGLLGWANVDRSRILAFRAPKGGAK